MARKKIQPDIPIVLDTPSHTKFHVLLPSGEIKEFEATSYEIEGDYLHIIICDEDMQDRFVATFKSWDSVYEVKRS